MSTLPKKTLFIAFVVSLGGFLFGFDASVISGVVKFIKPEFQLNDIQLGWVVSSPSFAAMFAMLIAGTLSDRVGRRRLLKMVAFLYAVSAGLSAIAGSYEMLVLARMIGGAAFGAALVLAPVYIAEIAPAKNRGKLVAIQQLNIVIGFSVAYFSNYYLLKIMAIDTLVTPDNAWRWMLGIELLPAVLYMLLLFLIPKSPRWLYLKQRRKEAYTIIEKLYGKATADEELASMEKSLESTEEKKESNAVSILFSKALRYVLVVGLVLGILQQITGVNAIYFYATTIFEQSGVGTDASFAQAVWIGIINVLFTLLAMYFIDKMGRRPLLLIGIAGITISMMITAYGFNQATYTLKSDTIAHIEGLDKSKVESVIDITYTNDVDFKNALKQVLGEQEYARLEGDIIAAAITMNPILILVGILGFVASFAFSIGPVMWVMLPELFPNNVRGLAISVIGFINALVSWAVQFIFPWELSNLGNALTYLMYGVLGIIGFFILIKILPETKGKSLEQLESELVKK